jgi:hypothetical protein
MSRFEISWVHCFRLSLVVDLDTAEKIHPNSSSFHFSKKKPKIKTLHHSNGSRICRIECPLSPLPSFISQTEAITERGIEYFLIQFPIM